jgi:hypothetical protein
MKVLQPYFAHPVIGDYDNNGVVDMNDYTAWQNAYGQTGAGLLADGNHDGVVNAADYTIWRDHANLGGPGSAAGVPEPNSLLLLVSGGLVAGFLFRRQHRA